MIYPIDFEIKIGFDRIKNLIKKECVGIPGKRLVDQINFSDDYEFLMESVGRVNEFKNILEQGLSFHLQEYWDLTPELDRIKTPGSFIDQEPMLLMKIILEMIAEITGFFKKRDIEEYPFLIDLTSGIGDHGKIKSDIELLINEKGDLRDSASSNLKKIRSDIRSKKRNIDRKIGQTLLDAKKQGWVKNDASVTIRSGRSVLPVPATHKRRIRGFIHDESATGQTFYIEPAEIFDLNNNIRELEFAERREIIRILTGFTDMIRPSLSELNESLSILAHLDLVRAKARFAISINATKPVLHNKSLINWKDAIHPLLYLSHKSQNRKVISQDIVLNSEQRILIISGPNAGGKSICLKTVGLLQYMIQSGLLVPVEENSEMGLFRNIFLDIGDEQSIDNDLSTYSSHLLHLKHFLENVDNRSLFLIDEFGSGTEPQLGGAIAEAVLEKFHKQGAFGVVTTHYANLKLLNERFPGIVNSAMLFDSKNMKPLYKLKIGRPGSSYAFEIARQIGFPAEILESATVITGITQLDFDQQLQQLELEKEELEKSLQKFKVADDFLAEMITKYELLNDNLKKSREKILDEAKEDARRIIDGSNRLIENTIREIREIQAEKEKTKKLRESLKKEAKNLMSQNSVGKIRQTEKRTKIQDPRTKIQEGRRQKAEGIRQKVEVMEGKTGKELKVGDFVKMKGQDIPGEITEIKGNAATVVFNHITIKVSTNKLFSIESDLKEITTPGSHRSQNQIINEINARMANFKLSIDIRGKRAEEAETEVKKYIDDAILLSIPEITILHGKGDGILRNIIRELLRSIPEVIHYEDEHIERGGHGITIIKLGG